MDILWLQRWHGVGISFSHLSVCKNIQNNIPTQGAITIFHIRLTWIIWHLISSAFHIPQIYHQIYQEPNNMKPLATKAKFTDVSPPLGERFQLDKLPFPFSLVPVVYATPSLPRLLNLFNYLYYHKVICLYSYTQFHIFAITINHEARRKSTLCQPLNHLNN